MLVSVVMSVYNCEEYIEETLDSILSQSMQDWECILIDDASTDHTWSIIQQYSDARIIATQNEKNMGLTHNLNVGINRAKGKYIIRIDGDDIAYSSRFQKQVAFMENHPEVVLSGCAMKSFGKFHNILKNDEMDEILRIKLMFNPVVFHPTFIIRKAVLDAQGIQYNESFLYAQDYSLLYQVIQYGKIANIPDVLMKYRVHDKQISIEKKSRQRECADVTREHMLNLLGIKLGREEKEYWLRYCAGERFFSEREKGIIAKIQDAIIVQNELKGLFDSRILREYLSKRLLSDLDENRTEAALKMSEKHLTLFLMMNQWVKIKQEGKKLEKYFLKKNYKEIAIYGMSYAGKTLLNDLKNSEIKIVYAIDKNIDNMDESIEIYASVDPTKHVDVIVITAVTYFEEIREQLKRNVKCSIISLEDVLYDM